MTWESQVVILKCSIKLVFLKISQNSQKNICAGVFFNKNQAGSRQLYQRDTLVLFFCVCVWALLNFYDKE